MLAAPSSLIHKRMVKGFVLILPKPSRSKMPSSTDAEWFKFHCLINDDQYEKISLLQWDPQLQHWATRGWQDQAVEIQAHYHSWRPPSSPLTLDNFLTQMMQTASLQSKVQKQVGLGTWSWSVRKGTRCARNCTSWSPGGSWWTKFHCVVHP